VQNAIAAGLTSVVVVAADSGTELEDCAQWLLASSTPVELIVSDNASSDGSVAALAARWAGDARLRIVHNGKNLGFGAGCNRGAAVASGDALLFLNPDCRLEANTLARLRAHAGADARIGLIGASIIDAAGVPEPASRRRDPLLRRALMTFTGLARFESRWPALAGVTVPPRDGAIALEEVEAVSGALMFLPRAAFERVGGFDEGYFLHCEDLDLCRRVRDAGLRVVCANDVPVVHLKGTSSRSRPVFVARHKHRGMWRWFVKFDPVARNPALRALVWCGLWAHFLALTPRYAWFALRARNQR
jgi:N-acetylglucosaminyl-diphospho-decaprenol L-rhamnosyltransferase